MSGPAWGTERPPNKQPNGLIRNVISNVALNAQSLLTFTSSEWIHSILVVCEAAKYSTRAGIETKGK